MLFHSSTARVIGRKRKLEIASIAIEQHLEVPHSALDIFTWVVGIDDIMQARRIGHQLHKPHSSLVRTGGGVEIRFRFDDGTNQVSIDTMASRRPADEGIVRGVKG